MTSSEVHKTLHRGKLYFKIDIFEVEPRAPSTLAPIYDTTFLFDSFPPVKGEIAPKEKPFTPIFSETTVFFLNFFHRRIRFDWGHK